MSQTLFRTVLVAIGMYNCLRMLILYEELFILLLCFFLFLSHWGEKEKKLNRY